MTEDATEHRLRVYVADTDAGGVAHHASWLRWYEQARSEWLRARGFALAECMAAKLVFVVVKAELSYRKPLRLDDAAVVVTKLASTGAASATFAQELRAADGAACGNATIKLACLDSTTLRPRPLPTEMLG